MLLKKQASTKNNHKIKSSNNGPVERKNWEQRKTEKKIEDRKKLNIEKRNEKKSQSIQQKNKKLTPTNIKQKQPQRSKKKKDEWKMFLEQLQQDSSSDECSEA